MNAHGKKVWNTKCHAIKESPKETTSVSDVFLEIIFAYQYGIYMHILIYLKKKQTENE